MPIDREKVLQAAQKHIEKRRFDRAIAEYQKIIQEDPNDARTLLKIGDLQARMEAYEAAIATYERVGRYYASQGFSVKAIAVYKQIREIIRKHVPKLADQYGHIIPKLAQLYQDLGLTGDALAAYDEYAIHLQRAGREREAIDIFRKIVEINGNNPLARLRLAEALLRENESDEAQSQFSTAAEILLGMDRRDDALKVMERMLYHKPDPILARRAAELYLQRGTLEDGMMALGKLQICFQADQRDLETLGLLASAFVAIGQSPKATEVRKEMARIARDQGDNDQTRKLAEQLLAEAPNDEAARALARQILTPAEVAEHSFHTSSKAAPPFDSQAAPPGSIAPAQLITGPSVPPEASVPAAAVSQAPVSLRVPEDAVIEVSEDFLDGARDLDELPSQALLSVPAPEQEGAESALPMAMPLSVRQVEVDEAQEAVEDIGGPQSFDAQSHTQQVLAQAQAYQNEGRMAQAIETLRIGLDVNPASVELRTVLKDCLWDTGDYDGALAELITLAAMHLDAHQDAEAIQELHQVLTLDPSNDWALQTLAQLGYSPEMLTGQQAGPDMELGPEASDAEQTEFFQGYPEPYAAADPSPELVDPLPSYDLEEINPAYAMSAVPPVAQPQAAYDQLLSQDDPFSMLGPQAMGQADAQDSSPLPAFPLSDEDRLALTHSPLASSGAQSPRPGISSFAPPMPAEGESHAPPPLTGTRAFQGGDSLEEALEEADFFASRGLFDDALSILEEQGARFPNHPLLLERIREVREAMAAAGGSGELVVPPSSELQQPPAPPPESVEDRAFDIAASLDAGMLSAPQPGPQAVGTPVDVEEVFAKFKEGVRAQVSESDSATHYDLGVAYREMGLLQDAIAEFQLAARDPKRECVCWSMIGMVHLDLSDMDSAIESFIRGLHAEQMTLEQELSLYYQLGNIYDALQNPREALYYFEKIARRDPTFRDVSARIRALQAAPVRTLQTAVGEDEFDRVFNDVFGNPKLS